MKKIMYFAAALLVLAGCQSSQEARENAPAEMVTIKGRIELPQGPNKIAPQSDWNTKTEGENINFQWEIGDEVAVIEMPEEEKMGDKGKMVYECKKFTVTSIDEEGTATLAGEALSSGMDRYLVFYPYIEITSTLNMEQASNAILLQQTYKKDSFKPIVMSFGEGNAFTLDMFNPAIHLQLKGAVVLGKIEYRELDINGDALEDSVAQMTFGTGLQLDNTTSTDVVLFVPVPNSLDYHGFELSFYDTAGQLIMKKQSTSETALSQNTITPFPVLEVKAAPTHAYVDLGLSVKWATCNVGATNPEDYGDYFAWGETSPYYDMPAANPLTWTGKPSGYAWESYCGESSFTEWSPVPYDANKNLLLTKDAAAVNWGGVWRMPTEAEFTELLDNCDNSWTTQNGVNGCLFTSTKEGYTDKSIFLPAAGYFNGGTSRSNAGSYDTYWSSSLSTNYPKNGYLLYVSSSYVGGGVNQDCRCYGLPVRPVCE